MTRKTIEVTEELYSYMLKFGVREPDILERLRCETATDPWARMQISPEQGQFMSLLVSIVKPKNILEIGTFTGYSSLVMMLNASPDCHLTTCDMSEEWTSIAERYWKEVELEQRITLKLAPAIETLQTLINEGQKETFELIFIDADKENYPTYYELSKQLLAPEGMLIIDNVFWGGEVANENDQSAATQGVRALNQLLSSDQDMQISMLPISDGITLARKK